MIRTRLFFPVKQDVLNNSDHQAVLFLGNLVEGKYSFTLTVTDSKGQTSTDSGTVEVRPGKQTHTYSTGFYFVASFCYWKIYSNTTEHLQYYIVLLL